MEAMKAADRVVFGHALTALLDRCTTGLPEATWAELERMGVSRTNRLPAYEFPLWSKAIEVLARGMYPEKSLGDAEYQLGRDFIERYAETLVGVALFSLLRLIGPKRTVRRLTRSFRTGNNFTHVEVRDEEANGCLVWFNVVVPPARWTEGILTSGLVAAGMRQVEVSIASFDGESAVYRVRWA